MIAARYDVENAVDFYTTPFGFTLRSSAAPAFAEVVRGNLRLLLSGSNELGRSSLLAHSYLCRDGAAMESNTPAGKPD